MRHNEMIVITRDIFLSLQEIDQIFFLMVAVLRCCKCPTNSYQLSSFPLWKENIYKTTLLSLLAISLS